MSTSQQAVYGALWQEAKGDEKVYQRLLNDYRSSQVHAVTNIAGPPGPPGAIPSPGVSSASAPLAPGSASAATAASGIRYAQPPLASAPYAVPGQPASVVHRAPAAPPAIRPVFAGQPGVPGAPTTAPSASAASYGFPTAATPEERQYQEILAQLKPLHQTLQQNLLIYQVGGRTPDQMKAKWVTDALLLITHYDPKKLNELKTLHAQVQQQRAQQIQARKIATAAPAPTPAPTPMQTTPAPMVSAPAAAAIATSSSGGSSSSTTTAQMGVPVSSSAAAQLAALGADSEYNKLWSHITPKYKPWLQNVVTQLTIKPLRTSPPLDFALLKQMTAQLSRCDPNDGLEQLKLIPKHISELNTTLRAAVQTNAASVHPPQPSSQPQPQPHPHPHLTPAAPATSGQSQTIPSVRPNPATTTAAATIITTTTGGAGGGAMASMQTPAPAPAPVLSQQQPKPTLVGSYDPSQQVRKTMPTPPQPISSSVYPPGSSVQSPITAPSPDLQPPKPDPAVPSTAPDHTPSAPNFQNLQHYEIALRVLTSAAQLPRAKRARFASQMHSAIDHITGPPSMIAPQMVAVKDDEAAQHPFAVKDDVEDDIGGTGHPQAALFEDIGSWLVGWRSGH